MSLTDLLAAASQGRSDAFFVNQYLSSPILNTPIKSFRQAYEGIDSGGISRSGLIHAISRHFCNRLPTLEYPTPKDYSRLFSSKSLPEARRELEIGQACAQRFVEGINTSLRIESEPTLPRVRASKNGMRYYVQMRYWEGLLGLYSRYREEGNRPVYTGKLKDDIFFTDGKVWVIQEGLTYIALSHDQVCMIKDALYSRHQVHIALSYLDYRNSFADVLEEHWQWQMSCLVRHDNQGYEIAKSTEALAKAYLSRVSADILTSDNDSFSSMIEKVRAKERKLGTSEFFLADKYIGVLSRTHDIQEVVDLFGLQKMCGHPIIDPKLGGRTAAAHARSPDQTQFCDALSMRACFVRVFLEGYIKKNGRWPRFSVPPSNGTKLHHLWSHGVLVIHRDSYPLADLEDLRFARCFDFDYFPNYLELMDDRAISFYRSNIAAQWGHESESSSRRLLLEMLSREDIDPIAIVSAIANRRIPLDWRVVTLYPKEREFKIAARMFAMLVFEIRLFFTMHEANLADSILPCMPALTMTDDRIAIQARFLELTRQPPQGEQAIFVELDLSSWNLRWRELSISLIGRDLDDLFGFGDTPGVYTFVHEFFESCLVHVRVGGEEPPGIEDHTPPESDLLWYNHLGGFEGIAQKLWSIATVAMIDRALWREPLSYRLTIQGDNVVVCARCPLREAVLPADNAKHWVDRITKLTAQAAAEVNQEMKPEECLASTVLTTYSKDVYIRGVEYYLTLKFHSRLFPTTSDDFPSVPNNVGAIFSGAAAAAERNPRPLRSYILAILHSASYLARADQLTTTCDSLSEDRLVQLLLRPSILGGWPILPCTDFLYRGSGDPLSKSLASLAIFQSSSIEARRIIHHLESSNSYRDDRNVDQLLQDPYSIPLANASSPTEAVSRQSRQALLSITRNRDIKELLVLSDSEYATALIRSLEMLRPFNPAIARDIVDCSVVGLSRTIRRMFVATSSLQKVTRSGTGGLITALTTAAREHWRFGHTLAGYRGGTSLIAARGTEIPWPGYCIYETCELLRAFWRPATPQIVGVSCYSPFDFPIVVPRRAQLGILLEARLPATKVTKRGPYQAFVGAATREKRSQHGYRITGTGLPQKSLRKLHEVSMYTEDLPLLGLLDHVSEARSNITLSSARAKLGTRVGGSSSHRYAARISERGAYLLGQRVYSTHVSISSDRAGLISASVVDYPIMFQEFFLTLISLGAERHYLKTNREIDRLLIDTTAVDLAALPINDLCLESLDVDQSLRRIFSTVDLTANNKLIYQRNVLTHTSGPASDYLCTSLGSYTPQGITGALRGVVSLASVDLGGRAHITTMSRSLGGDSALRIDILELASIGYRRFCSCLAEALARSIVVRLAATDPQSMRVVRSILVRAYTGALHHVAMYRHHPLLADDTLLAEVGAGGSLKYNSGPLLERYLMRTISGEAQSLVVNRDSRIYTWPVIIFSSDPPSIVSDALYTALCLIFVRESLYGFDHNQDLTDLVAIMHDHSSSDAVTACSLHELAVAFYSRAREAGRERLRIALQELTVGKRVRATRLDAREAVRMARDVIPNRTRQLVPQLTTGPLATADTIDLKLLVLSLSSIPASLNIEEPPRLDQMLFDTAVRRGSPVYSHGHALLSWLQCGSLFSGRMLLIIGSGLGACALVAEMSGATGITGHDLRRDIEPCTDSEGYRPLLYSRFARRAIYVQTDETFDTSGDFFDRSVSYRVLQYVTPATIIVLDFRQGTGASLRALVELARIRSNIEYCIRLRGEKSGIVKLCGIAHAYLGTSEAYVTQSCHGILEVILHGATPSSINSIGEVQINTAVLVPDKRPNGAPAVFLDARPYLSELFGARGIIGSHEGTSEVAQEAIEEITLDIGRYFYRSDFDLWTESLYALTAAKFVIATDIGRANLLRHLDANDLTLIVEDKRIPVSYTYELQRILTRVASCIIR